MAFLAKNPAFPLAFEQILKKLNPQDFFNASRAFPEWFEFIMKNPKLLQKIIEAIEAKHFIVQSDMKIVCQKNFEFGMGHA